MENQTYGRVQVPQNQRTLMSEARSRTQSIRRAAPRHSVSSPDILVEQQHGHTYAYTRSSPRASYFDRPENATKSLFTRGGQALRKKTTKLSLNLTTPNGSGDISLEHSVFESLKLGLHRGRLFQEAASKRRDVIKRCISEPFDFRHVTHTQRKQIQGLERVSNNHLVSEFNALRAGQRPKSELQGIKAKNLSRESAAGDSENTQPLYSTAQKHLTEACPSGQSQLTGPAEETHTSSSPSHANDKPLPETPSLKNDDCHSEIPAEENVEQDLPVTTGGRSEKTIELHSRPSVENFSRPVSRTSMTNPPKRLSSLNAVQLTGQLHDYPGTSTYSIRTSLARSRQNSDVGHAISTDDDIARPLKTSPLPITPLNGLHAVMEDQEEIARPKCYARRSTRTDISAPFVHSARIRRALSKKSKFPIGLEPIRVDDWENDVDFCYEQAAEADSNFNWHPHNTTLQPESEGDLLLVNAAAEQQSLNPVSLPLGKHHHPERSSHDTKHSSQESSILSLASSTADISRSSNSISSLPELDYSLNSSRESMDWEAERQPVRECSRPKTAHSSSPAKSPRRHIPRKSSYSLFPAAITPPQSP